MRSQLSRLLAFSVVGLLTYGASIDDAHADRRSSLAGNLLITDQDDIYIYPQLTLEHRNLASFDYFPGQSLSGILGANSPLTSGEGDGSSSGGDGGDGGNGGGDGPGALGSSSRSAAGVPNGPLTMGGSGLLLFGEETFAFGISTHRQDLYGATPQAFLGVGDLQLYSQPLRSWSLAGYSGPLPLAATPGQATPTSNGAPSTASGAPATFLQPLQLADLLFGIGLGDTGSLGGRLSFGQGLFREERLGTDVEDFETWSTTAIDLVLGFSLRGAFYLDLNLELALAFFNNTYQTDENNEPNYSDSASLAPSFSLSGRSIVDLRESVKLGILGTLHVNSATVTDEFGVAEGSATTPQETSYSSSNFFFEAGAGPLYQLPDETEVAAYATIGFGTSSYTDDNRRFRASGLLLPGFKLAMEHWILDWLAFRTGLSSRYYFAFQSREFPDSPNPNVSASSTYYEFLWSAGIGIAVGNFELAGTFQTPFVTNGPALLGGTGSGMWSLLNATYKF